MSTNKKTKSKTTKAEKTTKKEEKKEVPPIPKWSEGDATHGHSKYNLYGINGLWREKGCQEIGGMQVRIYLTENADAPISNRPDKHTVVLTGTHEKGVKDLNIASLQKTGATSRKKALELARHPSTWSTKAKTIVEKMAEDKAKAEAEAKEAEEKAKAEETATPQTS
tara:strand:- start:342 stop:842 length:501 start_codon:yes stop_codon:yes gene_type:complete